MSPTRYLMTAVSMLFIIGATFAADIDPAVKKVDDVNLGKLERGLKNVTIHYTAFTQELDKQFRQYLGDSLAGTAKETATYLDPVAKAAGPLMDVFNAELSENQVMIVQGALAREDEAYNTKAAKLIAERQAILDTAVAPIKAAMKGEGDKAKLTLDVFQPAADRLVEELKESGVLMKQIRIESDKIDYFLTSESRPLWEKAKLGKNGTYLFSAGYKKAMARIMLDYLRHNKYFNAERPLKEAMDEYKKDDKMYSLRLLYAFVLLINESNPDAVDKGYAIIKDAYESEKEELDRDRDSLAFNYLRVGTRLNRLDEATFLKLLDHVRFVENEAGLADLYNLALAKYIKEGDFANAAPLYKKAVERGLADQLPPSFVCMILLKTGEFEAIGAAVNADSIDELKKPATK